MHITETEASDSIAFSCCASTPRRAIFAAGTAAVSDKQDQALGHDVHDRRREGLDRLRLAHVADRQRDPERDAERHHQPDEDISSRSIAFSSGDRGCRNARAVAADPRGAAVGATAVASNVPPPSTANEPDSTGSPAPRATGSRLAGQDRLVEREPVAAQQRPVGDDLVPALHAHHVADDDLRDRDLAQPPSRTTVAVGATTAANRSSARLARTS